MVNRAKITALTLFVGDNNKNLRHRLHNTTDAPIGSGNVNRQVHKLLIITTRESVDLQIYFTSKEFNFLLQEDGSGFCEG